MEEEDIEDVVQKIYAALFTSSLPSTTACEEVLEAMGPRISAEDNNLLLWPITKDEIFASLSQMQTCKVLGPDGMHTIFYNFFGILGRWCFELYVWYITRYFLSEKY